MKPFSVYISVKKVIPFLIAVGGLGLAQSAPAAWKDGNDLYWTALPVKTTYARGVSRCRDLKSRLPRAAEFFEALDYGLLNFEVNEELTVKGIDWVWIGSAPTGLSFRRLASRWEDEVEVPGDERHWVFCVHK